MLLFKIKVILPVTKISTKTSVAVRIYRKAAVLPGAGYGFGIDKLMTNKEKGLYSWSRMCVYE